MSSIRIFHLVPSNSDNDRGRPDVDLSDQRNQGPAWQIMERIAMGKLPAADYIPVRAFVNSINVEKYHGFGFVGCGLKFYSSVVRETIMKMCPNDVNFLPLTVNGIPFFTPHFESTTNALDQTSSKLTRLPSDPSRVLWIDYWSFQADKLRDPMVFCVPESRLTLLISEKVAVALSALQLRGIDIFSAEGLSPGHPQWQRRTIEDVQRN